MTALVKVYHSAGYKSIVKCTKYYIAFLEDRRNCKILPILCRKRKKTFPKI
jgi:hypothetical protein